MRAQPRLVRRAGGSTCFVGRRAGAPSSGQHGIAALVVVMVLFFVVSLVAAYASRNLIFEQRTSANQYKSTQALEIAEAGLEWALAMLNSGRVDANCSDTTKVAAAPNDSFRQRYLDINPVTGFVTARKQTPSNDELWPSCKFDGGAWTCSCPENGAPVLAGSGSAFRVRFLTLDPPVVGTVRVEVRGCTTMDNTCLDFPLADPLLCGGTVCVVASLHSGLKAPPTAALSAKGTVNLGGAAMTVANSSTLGSGVTIHSGKAVAPTGLILYSRPGSPASASVVDNDALLDALLFTRDRMFAAFFGLMPDTYRDQPGAKIIDCAGGCTWTGNISNVVRDNPGRVIWANGNVDINAAGNLCVDGVLPEPCVIVATGNVTFSAAANLYGMVYSHSADWATSGAGRITGAAASSGDITGNATTQIVYDSAVLARMRYTTGSFARVPGSWKDIP
jgi:Tfp pilus assembly protein PilX